MRFVGTWSSRSTVRLCSLLPRYGCKWAGREPVRGIRNRSAPGLGSRRCGAGGYRGLPHRHGDQDPRNRGRFVLGIECDGAMYHSSRVARDRDRLREEVLVGLGWTLHRIWGPSWYRDRPGEERRLKDAIQAATTAEPASRVHVVSPPTVVAFEDLDLAAPPPWSEPYEAASVSGDSQRDIADPRASATFGARSLGRGMRGPDRRGPACQAGASAWDATSTERRREAIRRGFGALDGPAGSTTGQRLLRPASAGRRCPRPPRRRP